MQWLCQPVRLASLQSIKISPIRQFRTTSVITRQGYKDEELEKLLNTKYVRHTQMHLPSTSNTTDKVEGRPFVLMVGWVESRLKVLSKYASMYTDVGVPCLCGATRVTYMWYTNMGKNWTSSILKWADSTLEQPVSVILHIFSGGGSAIFPQLLEEQTNDISILKSKLNPVGVIFDSGPANFSRKVGIAASNLMYKQGGSSFLTHKVNNVIGITTNALIGSRKRSEIQAFMNDPKFLDVEQLYLHSERDSVATHDWVANIIAEQKSKGRPVDSYCWKDMEHVRHFIEYPEEYKEQVYKFLKKCRVL